MVVIFELAGCGSAGDSPSSGTSNLVGSAQIRGTVGTSSGISLAGWYLALVDTSTEITRLSSVSTSGVYVFSGVDTSATYTFVLLSPTLRVSASMFQTSASFSEDYYLQNFKITDTILPSLIVDGKTLKFSETDRGVNFVNQLFNDSNLNKSPDAFDLTGASFALANNIECEDDCLSLQVGVGTKDKDGDGILNTEDSDVDGDGLVNVFDPDDNNDGELDVFETDSDDDTVDDYTVKSGDQYFEKGVEWITVNYKFDGATNKSTITFVTKVRPGVNPISVQVVGPDSLLNSASVEYIDENNTTVSQTFNGMLLDEGNDGDSSANDLIFGRIVTLASTSELMSNTAVFFRLAFGSGTNPVFVDFPYLLSLGDPDPIQITSFATPTTSITHSSGLLPFGSNSYIYSVQAYDESGSLVWTSDSVLVDKLSASGAGTVEVPTGISNDTNCTFKATARTVDRIPGFSNYTVVSSSYSGTCP